MLEFKPVTIKDFSFATALVEEEQITEYGIAPICLYAPLDGAEFCRFEGIVAVKSTESCGICVGVLGTPSAETLLRLTAQLTEQLGSFTYVYLSQAKLEFYTSALGGRYALTDSTDDDQCDYLYKTADFLRLDGTAARHKREGYADFNKNYSFTFSTIDGSKAEDCLAVMDKWCARKNCADCEYSCEKTLLQVLFSRWNEYPIEGGIMYVDGTPAAFFLGERLGNTLIGYHQKTATTEIKGLSYAIYLESVSRLFSTCEYVNIGPDMGNLGLRQFKRQFKPYTLLRKYNLKVESVL